MDAGLIARLSEISEEEARILQGGGVDMQLYNEKRRKSVEASKFLEGKLISIRTHTRFAPFPPHRHQFIEIMYVCQGAITHVGGSCSSWAVIPGTRSGPRGSGTLGSTSSSGPPSSGPPST